MRTVAPKNFFGELKRRNVYRAAVAYGVVAWFLTQLTTQVFPFFEIPNSAVRFVVIALAVGFPIAMLLAWVYEFAPEGIVRTEDLDPVAARSVQRTTGRILDFVIIGVLLLVIAMLVVGRLPFYRQTGESISQKSIAVLPFENRSEDKANAYFADGIQDEILTRLSKIADLKVISRTSTKHYKSAPDNLPEIAKQLGVAHILEGSVQRSGDAVTANVQLIKAATDSHLSPDTLDRKLTDIFSVESEVAKAIAEQLRAHLTDREEQVIAAKPTDNPEAYDAYLRGVAYTLKAGANDPVNALGAQKYLKEAERLDPRNAFLLIQHALSYQSLRRFPEALRKLDEVLNITPDDIDTLVYKAATFQAEGDLPRAAALLAPLHPNADQTLALETQVGQAILERRPAPIIARLKEILAKPDPALGYLNGELRFWLGWAQEVAGDHAAAQESWKQARSELEPFLRQQPENWVLIGDLALTNMGLGDKTAAFAFAEKAIAVNPIEKDPMDGPGSIEILARVTARMGEPDRAISALQELLSTPYESPLNAANVPLTPALLRLDPMFDPLRNDPRFQKLSGSAPK